MMSTHNATAQEQAIDWTIRMRDPAFAEWDAFTLWLEQDPTHSRIYDEVAIADLDAEPLFAPQPDIMRAPLIAADAPRSGMRRRSLLGWAAAASLLAVSSYTILQSQGAPYTVETGPGVHRTIALADGSRIDMNGDTRLILDRENDRVASLERGEALFTIRHDEARPFIVSTGDATLIDVGTVFNVQRLDAVTNVAVSEGEVIFKAPRAEVRLPAGKSVRAADGDTAAQAVAVDPAAIGAWQEGRLVYSEAPLAAVAADLSRNLGTRISVSPTLAASRFSGVLRLDREDAAGMQRLAAVMGVAARRTNTGWMLVAAVDEGR